MPRGRSPQRTCSVRRNGFSDIRDGVGDTHKGEVNHGEEETQREVEDHRDENAVEEVRSCGQVGRDYLSGRVVRHGHDKAEDEHVDQADERDGRGDGLVVWPDVEDREAYGLGEGAWGGSKGCDVSAAREELGNALCRKLSGNVREVPLGNGHEIRARGQFAAGLGKDKVYRLHRVVGRICVCAGSVKTSRGALVDNDGSPGPFLNDIMLNGREVGQLRRRCDKVP